MGTTVLLIVIVAIVVIAIAYRVSRGRRGGGLRSLSPENQARYAQSWSGIQARFRANPAGAVQEADQLVASILRDRGAKMDDGWRPAEMHRAHELGRTNGGNPTIEDRRSAMLQYEIIVDDAVGESTRKSLDAQRREVAP